MPPVNAALDTVEPDAAGTPIANTAPSDTATALTMAAADRDRDRDRDRFEILLFIFPTLVRRSHWRLPCRDDVKNTRFPYRWTAQLVMVTWRFPA